jgi:hypothetical protein
MANILSFCIAVVVTITLSLPISVLLLHFFLAFQLGMKFVNINPSAPQVSYVTPLCTATN